MTSVFVSPGNWSESCIIASCGGIQCAASFALLLGLSPTMAVKLGHGADDTMGDIPEYNGVDADSRQFGGSAIRHITAERLRGSPCARTSIPACKYRIRLSYAAAVGAWRE